MPKIIAAMGIITITSVLVFASNAFFAVNNGFDETRIQKSDRLPTRQEQIAACQTQTNPYSGIDCIYLNLLENNPPMLPSLQTIVSHHRPGFTSFVRMPKKTLRASSYSQTTLF